MNIEDIFKRCTFDFNKLIDYGFNYNNGIYTFEKNFLNNDFKALITIDKDGNINGKVIDLQMNEEYTQIKMNIDGKYVNKVRNLFKNILIDIKNSCFINNYFKFDQANRINNYINNKYHDNAEFLWKKFPFYAVYRNKNNKKWYSIIMNVDLSKISDLKGEVEIINLKLTSDKVGRLLKENGYYKAYHMNKEDWISIVLNDTLSDNIITSLIDESYNLIDRDC